MHNQRLSCLTHSTVLLIGDRSVLLLVMTFDKLIRKPKAQQQKAFGPVNNICSMHVTEEDGTGSIRLEDELH
jgi:hypothetical protein